MHRVSASNYRPLTHVLAYNGVDAKLDNPHATQRQLREIVRAERCPRQYRRVSIRQRLREGTLFN